MRFRRGLFLIPVGLLAAVLLVVCGRFLASYRPPAGRPTKTTGSAPVSLSGPAPTAASLRASAESANVVIVVLDAARADHFGCYGYPRDTTPNVDRIAEQSLLFEQHFSQFPHTRPSTTSLFTGQYPDTHGVQGLSGSIPKGFTLAGALGSAGYETAFISGSGVASPAMGLGDDFGFVSARTSGAGRGVRSAAPRRDPEQVLDDLSSWLDRRRQERFLAYLHFLPPHGPRNPPAEMVQLFAGKKPPYLWRGRFVYREIKPVFKEKLERRPRDEANLYDADLRYADWAVGEVVKLLEKRSLLENTLLIITSDHGEAFGEHGYLGHRDGLYDEHVHIPLVMRFPGARKPVGRVRALTETVDLLPTVLDLLALPIPKSVQGRSLVPLITGETPAVHDFVFARAEGAPESYLVRDQRWAMILFKGGRLRALYNLRDDPWQTRNVVAQQSAQAARMAAAFTSFARRQQYPPLDFVDPDWKPERRPPAARLKLSNDQKRELKALGYLK
ncbi:MAG: sulfatase [Armatimonadota bacterium]